MRGSGMSNGYDCMKDVVERGRSKLGGWMDERKMGEEDGAC